MKRRSSYSQQERESYQGMITNIIYAQLLFALRSKDSGPKFYIQDIKAQTDDEKICQKVASIAGEVYAELKCNGKSEKFMKKEHKNIINKSWEIYKNQNNIQTVIQEFLQK